MYSVILLLPHCFIVLQYIPKNRTQEFHLLFLPSCIMLFYYNPILISLYGCWYDHYVQ